MQAFLTNPVFLIALILFVLVVGRGVSLWYWRINDLIGRMDEQNRLLKGIHEKLGGSEQETKE